MAQGGNQPQVIHRANFMPDGAKQDQRRAEPQEDKALAFTQSNARSQTPQQVTDISANEDLNNESGVQLDFDIYNPEHRGLVPKDSKSAQYKQ